MLTLEKIVSELKVNSVNEVVGGRHGINTKSRSRSHSHRHHTHRRHHSHGGPGAIN